MSERGQANARWSGLAAAYLLYFGLLGTLQPYLATLYLEHGLPASQVGPSVAILYVFAGLMPLVGTALAARLHANTRSVFACFSVLALALVASLVCFGNGMSRLGYVAVVAGLTAAYAPLNALLDTAALAACQQNDWSFGRLRLMGSLGYILTATSLGRVLPASHVSDSVHVAATVLVALLLAVSAWLPAAAVIEPSVAAEVATAGRERPSANALLCLIVACGLHYASFGPFMYGFTLYGQSVGLSPMAIGLGWSLGVASEVITFSLTAALIARFGWRPLLWVAFCVAPLRWALLSAAPHPVTFFLTQPMHGPSFALFYAAAMAALAQVRPERRAQRSQTVFCALVAGLASGPAMLVAGYAYASMSLGSMFACMLPANAVSLVLLAVASRQEPAATGGASEPRSA